jgi:hypothetical protein
VQEVLEAAMDVVGGREMLELFVERGETGLLELQRIGGGETAIENIVVLRGAALGKEDDHFFDKMLFQGGSLPGVFQQRRR